MEKSSDNASKKKKTMGRRKIEMKKIEKRSSLQVTFSKRRAGLFKKASELSVLCGCEIAILVQSPAEKMYSFGHPSADSTIHRFLTNDDSNCGGEKGSYYDSSSRLGYAEALRKIQLENNNNNKNIQENDGGLWFDRSIEGMGIDDLEEYLEGLHGLLVNVQNRLTEVKKNNKYIVKGMKNDNVCRAVMAVDPQSSNGLDGNDYLQKISDEIFKGMRSDEAVTMVPPQTDAARCSTSPSSSSSLEGYDIDVEKLLQECELVSMGSSGSVDNHNNDRGGSSSSASVMAPAQNDDRLPSLLCYDDFDDVTLGDVINWCREHDGFDFGQFLQN